MAFVAGAGVLAGSRASWLARRRTLRVCVVPGRRTRARMASTGPMKASYRKGDRVILFDGVCNVCNFGVDTVLRLDSAQQFKFASLQGEAGLRLLEEYSAPKDLSTMVYIEDGVAYVKSDAVLRIGSRLPLFGLASRFTLATVPKVVRDWLYMNILANNRYTLFGKRSSCRVPTQQEQKLFLD
mmetsp:Transcript_55881/g.137254  ORF Transcript_55881/g.137254 Transcript_55881/m.137254 type:complete len:183 (+) Transcript_55881:751-1299(+)